MPPYGFAWGLVCCTSPGTAVLFPGYSGPGISDISGLLAAAVSITKADLRLVEPIGLFDVDLVPAREIYHFQRRQQLLGQWAHRLEFPL